MGMSLYIRGKFVRPTYYLGVEYNLNIIADRQSLEVCEGHFESLGLPIALPVEKKLEEQYLNSFLCGFRKAQSTQHSLFRLIQRWQNELEKSGFVWTILMDLSKAYDCTPHGLMIAKFEVHGHGKSG